MVSLSDAPVNLFLKICPHEDIKKLWSYVNSSERNRNAFLHQAQTGNDPLVQDSRSCFAAKSAKPLKNSPRAGLCPEAYGPRIRLSDHR